MEITTQEERFNRAIYLNYVELGLDNSFKRVSEEVFKSFLYPKIDRIETVTFDKKRVYRLADTKQLWMLQYGKIAGEVWEEVGAKSFWISTYLYP